MTVRVTTLKGPDAGLYYVEALGGYYLDAGEPLGVWQGRGAERLGLEGEIDDEVFLALMAGLAPDTGEPLGRRYGDRSVRGFDATASAPKTVSVRLPSATRRPATRSSPPTTPRSRPWWVGSRTTPSRGTASTARW